MKFINEVVAHSAKCMFEGLVSLNVLLEMACIIMNQKVSNSKANLREEVLIGICQMLQDLHPCGVGNYFLTSVTHRHVFNS